MTAAMAGIKILDGHMHPLTAETHREAQVWLPPLSPGGTQSTRLNSSRVDWVSAAAFQQVSGLRARAFPASEILQFPGSVFVPGARPLLVASSRSGTTTETLRAVGNSGNTRSDD